MGKVTGARIYGYRVLSKRKRERDGGRGKKSLDAAVRGVRRALLRIYGFHYCRPAVGYGGWLGQPQASGWGERGEKGDRTETGAAGDARGGSADGGCLNLNLPPVCILWASSKFLRACRNPGGAQKPKPIHSSPSRSLDPSRATDLRDRQRIPAASYREPGQTAHYTRACNPNYPSVRLRLLHPTRSHVWRKIMTPADLKGLRRVTSWCVPAYARIFDRLSSTIWQTARLFIYVRTSFVSRYHGWFRILAVARIPQ